MNDEMVTILKEIIKRHGRKICDSVKCIELIMKHHQEYEQETNALINAIKINIPINLLFSYDVKLREEMFKKLQQDFGMEREVAAWVIGTWAYALGSTDKLPDEEEFIRIIPVASNIPELMVDANKPRQQISIPKLTARKSTDTVLSEEFLSYFDKGSEYFLDGQYEEALRCFEKSLEINGEISTVWFKKGKCMYALKLFKTALICFDKVIDLEPDHITALQMKGECLQMLGYYGDALSCYESIDNTDHVEHLLSKATCLIHMRRPVDAIDPLDRFLDINPSNASAWLNKGSCLTIIEQHESALICFDKATEFEPENSEAWYQKGMSLKALNLDSLGCFNKALKLNPNHLFARVFKGLILFSLGQYKDSLHCFGRALIIDPKDVGNWLQYGMCQCHLGDVEDALYVFNQVVKLNPESDLGWLLKGSCEEALKLFAEAYRSYEQYIIFNLYQDPEVVEKIRQNMKGLEDYI